MKQSILLLLLAVSVSFNLFAQDNIYKLKGPVVKAKVIEIGIDEIKYRLYDDPNGPIYVVDKSSLNRIEYADGRVEKFKVSYKDPANYDGQYGKALKFNFLSPLLGYSQFAFEKSISPLKSYELGFGIIGAGRNRQFDNYYFNGNYETYKRSALGLFVDAGLKFNKLPNFLSRGMRMTHLMQGSYFKPAVTLGYYSDHALNYKSGNPVIEKRNTVFGALMLNLGHQWIFGERFLLDIYGGLGYAFDNMKRNDANNYYSNDFYNHFVVQKPGESGADLGLDGGIRIGFLLK